MSAAGRIPQLDMFRDILRRCVKCKVEKPHSAFYPDKARIDGLCARCIDCTKERQRQWRAKNPEKARECWKRSREKHLDKCLERARQWRRKYPERQQLAKRKCRLRKEYGLTIAEYDAMVAAQKGRCAICRNPPRAGSRKDKLHIDHDHVTGKVRGLLCDLCNRGVGMLRDDPKIMRSAARYVLRTRQ